ncbi:DUF3810 domain-containing protein [Aureitalea marina]|uniref:Amino acid permease n=1 Tax=Aureitalea marina TaxID=930804 RepID=A0A2S7KQ03_9FLAO|nr:DUF3810 domain-containing protein [Aureitalea marina]PQB04704.1 amino acid permease [Aureitalea marina]
MKRSRSDLLLTLFLPVQFLLLWWIRHYPEWIESWYSTGVYPYISVLPRYLFGWIPFSVGDIFYPLIGIIALRWVYKNFRRLRYDTLNVLFRIGAATSVIYFVFHIIWGLNYYRVPLNEKLDLDRDYTTAELIDLTKRFIQKSNEVHVALGYADTAKIDLPYSNREIMDSAVLGYDQLKEQYPNLSYAPISVKQSGWSLGLTYMGYSGYYNPFSGEAQVNRLIKSYRFPVVSSHEIAHQLGYAAENEANFLATLATIHHPDPYVQYTGYIFALRYLVNEVARRDLDTYRELVEEIHPGILKGYREMREFWESYENPLEDISKAFWNQFLKANNQDRGIMSYSYMVALVINYFEDRPL